MRIVRHAPPSIRILAAAGLAVLLAGPAAHAAGRTTMSIHVHDLKVELIDLDPLDGIAPSVTWGAPQRYALIGIRDGAFSQARDLHGAGALALSSENMVASMQAGPDGWSMSASGDPRAGYLAAGETLAAADIDFVLAPRTAMFVSVMADMHAENHLPDAHLWRTVTLTGSLFRNVGGVESWSHFGDRRASLEPASERYRLAGVLHAGDSASEGSLTFSAGNSFVFLHQTSPVPEPGAYAMLLAGLGLIAGARHRRGKR